MRAVAVAVLVTLLVAVPAAAYNNGFGAEPPRGWNTWCSDVRCGVDWCAEWNIKEMALAMMTNGLQSAGYNVIQMDDCWAASQRSSGQRLTWNATRFPSGIPALTKWLNARGFLFGLYLSLGDRACEGDRIGSYGHYDQDAQTVVSWGISRVKIDYCGGHLNRTAGGPYYQHKQFSDAFNRTGVPVEIFLCRGYGPHDPPPVPAWVQTLAQGGRSTNDHHDSITNTLMVIEGQAKAVAEGANKFMGWVQQNGTLVNSYFWPSVDLLYTGGQGCPAAFNFSAHCAGQSDSQYRMFFSVAAISSSDLMISTDVRYMTPVMQEALLNLELLALQRDRSVIGTRLTANAPGCAAAGTCQVWTRALSDGSVAVVLLNSDLLATQSFAVSLNVLFPNAQQGLVVVPRDLWKHEDGDPVKVDGGSLAVYNLAPTSAKAFRLIPRNPW